MDSLLAARLQMAISLGFHMVFASLAVGMPLLMLMAEGLYLRRGDRRYLELARTWSKVTAITFAVGAVSGTALSFELGLLWPRFMEMAGPAVGPAFTTEGFAFFTEAIFLGLYLYGWNRLSPRAHWLCGIPVAISSAASSVLVVAANAWMQNPVGASTLLQNAEAFDPVAALFGNPAWPVMAIHSTLATYAATGFGVAAVYAFAALRGHRDPMRRSALRLAIAVATVSALLMPVTGDASAKFVARNQPVKFAAMEAQFETEAGAPLRFGGIPDVETRTVRYDLEIPGLLSWLAHGDSTATVRGLEEVPRHLWPNVPLTHVAFQVMVVAGILMVAVTAWYWWVSWRRKERILEHRRLMRVLVAAGPLGIIALEAGWIVTEVGRQPWIVRDVMTVAEAVTPAPGVITAFVGFMVLYLLLSVTLIWLLLRIRHQQPAPGPAGGPGGGQGAQRSAEVVPEPVAVPAQVSGQAGAQAAPGRPALGASPVREYGGWEKRRDSGEGGGRAADPVAAEGGVGGRVAAEGAGGRQAAPEGAAGGQAAAGRGPMTGAGPAPGAAAEEPARAVGRIRPLPAARRRGQSREPVRRAAAGGRRRQAGG